MSKPSKSADPAIHQLARRFAFLDAPGVRRNLWIGLAAIALAFAGADLLIHRHALFHGEDGGLEGAPGFYSAFGTVAFVVVVLGGWILRRLLGRSEDYYAGDERGG